MNADNSTELAAYQAALDRVEAQILEATPAECRELALADDIPLESDLDGWDFVAASVLAIASTVLGTSEKFAQWLNGVHDAASGAGGNADIVQSALGKLFAHKGDAMDWMVPRGKNETETYRLFHRLFFGHDPLSTAGLGKDIGRRVDNPFLLMFNQEKVDGKNLGMRGVIQAVRHLIGDTFSKQGLPLPGSSHLEYDRMTPNGERPWNYLIDISQRLSEETTGNKAMAEPLYEHLFTVRAQDLAGGTLVCTATEIYLKARNISDGVRKAQVRLLSSAMAFYLQAIAGAVKQNGVPYINAPLGAAMAMAMGDLLIKSNLETYRLGKETRRLEGETDRLLAEHDNLRILVLDEMEGDL